MRRIARSAGQAGIALSAGQAVIALSAGQAVIALSAGQAGIQLISGGASSSDAWMAAHTWAGASPPSKASWAATSRCSSTSARALGFTRM